MLTSSLLGRTSNWKQIPLYSLALTNPVLHYYVYVNNHLIGRGWRGKEITFFSVNCNKELKSLQASVPLACVTQCNLLMSIYYIGLSEACSWVLLSIFQGKWAFNSIISFPKLQLQCIYQHSSTVDEVKVMVSLLSMITIQALKSFFNIDLQCPQFAVQRTTFTMLCQEHR